WVRSSEIAARSRLEAADAGNFRYPAAQSFGLRRCSPQTGRSRSDHSGSRWFVLRCFFMAVNQRRRLHRRFPQLTDHLDQFIGLPPVFPFGQKRPIFFDIDLLALASLLGV